MIRAAAVLAAFVLFAPCVLADWQARSWSRWDISDGGAEATVGIERIELQRLGLGDDAGWLGAELPRALQFSSGGLICAPSSIEPQASPATLLVMRMRFHCEGKVRAPEIRVRLLHGLTAQPLHHASIVYRGIASEALLTPGSDAVSPSESGPDQSVAAVLATYSILGFWHILEGTDHIAFLLCLLLAAPGIARRVWMATGFTLGHSVTLSLSALGLLRVQTAGVEALIGFTVALLAAEVWQRSNGGRVATLLLSVIAAALLVAPLAGVHVGLPVSAAAALLVLAPAYLALAARTARVQSLHIGIMAVFGLVHGLGFASALHGIGLPDGRSLWALAGFNLGVEAGQLVLLLLLGALLSSAIRIAGRGRASPVAAALSGLLLTTGIFWLVERAI